MSSEEEEAALQSTHDKNRKLPQGVNNVRLDAAGIDDNILCRLEENGNKAF